MNRIDVASPAGCFEQFSAISNLEFYQSLTNLNAYIDSWKTEDGLGGMIATWWSSSVETAVSHPMNQAPYIQGAVRLFSAGIPGNWSHIVEEQGRHLIGKVDSNGLLKNGWGDLPGRPLAPVIGFSAAGALYSAASMLASDFFIAKGDEILDGYERMFSKGDRLSHGVSNQTARWALTYLQRYALLGDHSNLEKAVSLGDTLIAEQVSTGPKAGAIYQGTNSDILITVYVGKCLYPLLALFNATGEERFLKAALRLGEYLVSSLSSSHHFFTGSCTPVGRKYKLAAKFGAISRRLLNNPGLSARFRRHFIGEWTSQTVPVFIARSADSLRGLIALGKYDEAYAHKAHELLELLCKEQLGHGGFPNSYGFNGDLQCVGWQDKVASVRWNSYVFQLLAEVVASNPDVSQDVDINPTVTWPLITNLNSSKNVFLRESQQKLEQVSVENGVEWSVDKTTGKASCSPSWKGELTGARNFIGR